ncbi:hypothetical protein ACFH04_08600 [Streptomyces noboritoensis]|uniref:Lipoprotein n=1 Tax=Streptomyces noboritoensis TaxID=67337 RepID=A0ABV6TDB8_9ACTN
MHTLCVVSVRMVLWRRQSSVWAAVVLAVVVAGLVHVLGCAHGPQDDGVGRADSLLSATSVPLEHASVKPSRDAEAEECAGVDAPAWMPGAVVTAPSIGAAVQAVEYATVRQSAPSRVVPRAGPEQGRALAELGVWRT